MKKPEAKKYIDQYINWAFAEFGFAPANLSIVFKKECADDVNAVMSARMDYPYRMYTVTVYDNAFDMSKDNIKHSIHHELIHFILQEMCYVRTTNNKDEWRCALEKAVDHLAHLIKFDNND